MAWGQPEVGAVDGQFWLCNSGEINNRSARATLTVVINSKSAYAFVNVGTQNRRQRTCGNYRSINLIPPLLLSVPTLCIIVYFSSDVLSG
jgi:hypothetical protein